ncbi:MAG: nucleotidyltransferase domain-containing protein, partial [Candidatus Woesearchaeota archaeon]
MAKKKAVKKKTSMKKPDSKSKDLTSDYEIAYDFSIRVYKRFKETIKSIVLFGSAVKGEAKPGSDLDIIIFIDDCTIEWDQELIAWYREELRKLIDEKRYNRELHINTVTMSTFWDEIRAGEPVALNILRYGQALIDFGGFFDPLKVLLAKGKIRPSPEAIFNTLKRAPLHIAKAKFGMVATIENLYWSMVDASHAALMAANQVPPSPEHVPAMLQEIFVSKKRLDEKYVKWYKETYTIAHEVLHGKVKELEGKEIDEL